MSSSPKMIASIKAAAPGVQYPAADASIEYGLGDSLAYQLRQTYKAFIQNLQPFLDAFEIPFGMWYMLRALWEEDGLTQAEISQRIGIVAPAAVEQLKNMKERGLIQRRRSAQDRRKIHIYLTPKGAALKARLLPFAPYVNGLAVQGLTPGEIGFLRLALARIQQNLAGAVPTADSSEPEATPRKRRKARRQRTR